MFDLNYFNKKKHYFDTFMSEKHFEKQPTHSQIGLATTAMRRHSTHNQ
jgi:hypothetical protein